MQTNSIIMQTLCVPCACRCRYCLLSWDGRLIGADYARSECVALRWFQWLKELRPEISFHFSYGFSMEHPDIAHALDFLKSIDSVSAHYLQMDGMRTRDDSQLASLTALLAEHSVEHLNFTFYGLPEYHDAFAARKGDFDLMLRTVKAALGNGLMVSAGIPLSHENTAQAEALLSILQDTGMQNIRYFVPHSEGRGTVLYGNASGAAAVSAGDHEYGLGQAELRGTVRAEHADPGNGGGYSEAGDGEND